MKTVLQLKLEYGLKFKPGYYFNIDARVTLLSIDIIDLKKKKNA